MQSKLEAYLSDYLSNAECVSHNLLNLFLGKGFSTLSRESHTGTARKQAVSSYYGNICQFSFALC